MYVHVKKAAGPGLFSLHSQKGLSILIFNLPGLQKLEEIIIRKNLICCLKQITKCIKHITRK